METIKSRNGGWGILARAVIEQRSNGAILFLNIDGRTIKSPGVTNMYPSSTTVYYDGSIF